MVEVKRIVSGIILVVFSYAPVFASDPGRPNVVLIFADDLRYSGLHTNGCSQVRTPNLDQIAAQGVVFDQAYLMGSFSPATCMPSRAMLLTGRGLFDLQDEGPEDPGGSVHPG